MPRHAARVTVVLILALSFSASACGKDTPATPANGSRAAPQTLKDCRAQWHDVAESVIGLDQDTNPSALASRWNSVAATVDYYENTKTATNCRANVEAQVKAITALRQFSEKLRPYDMAFQLGQVASAVDLYLHDPLPAPARNENGKLVKPPSKAAVIAAMHVLTIEAAAANAELQPGWGQLVSVELEDSAAVSSALQDLDFLAQDSASWRRCEEALQVIVAAIRAQEGLVGAPAEQPTGTPTS